MTETRVVIATVIAVALAIASVVTGVAIIAGIGWAFIAAGVLVGGSAPVGAFVLLREGST